MRDLSNERLPLPALVATSLLGIYALIMVGATISVTDVLTVCRSWPTCDGRWLVPLSDPIGFAMAHRVVALIVGIILAATVLMAWWDEAPRRVRLLLTAALVLYPVQGFIGRLVALEVDGPVQARLHLWVGVAIFSLLVISFARILELRHPGGIDRTETVPSEAGTAIPPPAVPHELSRLQLMSAYLQLTKPRLMWLLCLVAAAGMALAAGPALRATTIVATLGGGVLAIGASGTFNHILERDVDRRMARTANRPIVTDVVPIGHAFVFGVSLAVLSIAVFVLFVNPVAAALTLAAIAFYSVIYTLVLKPNSVQNTAIGGIAGALPALIGWAAVTGGIELPGIVLALVVFCWTPAHFYNLAMAYREDYEAGGFPMLPVVHGDRVARKHVLYWAGATMLMTAALAATGTVGLLFATVGVGGAAGFVYMIRRLHTRGTRGAAIRTFHASNAYLGALLLVIAFDALIG